MLLCKLMVSCVHRHVYTTLGRMSCSLLHSHTHACSHTRTHTHTHTHKYKHKHTYTGFIEKFIRDIIGKIRNKCCKKPAEDEETPSPEHKTPQQKSKELETKEDEEEKEELPPIPPLEGWDKVNPAKRMKRRKLVNTSAQHMYSTLSV